MSRTTVRPEETPAAARSRLDRVLLASILLLAFVLRLVYVLQSRESPSFTQPSMDALYHLEWARAFARGEPYQPGPFFRAPLYPWFLGALFRLFGENLLLVRIVQAAIGTASVGLVHLVAARAFGPRTGVLAALFASLYWVVIYFEGEILLPVLEIFFDLLAIWLSLRIEDRRTRGRAALAGLAWGLAAIVRPNVLLFAPLVAAWVFLRTKGAQSPRPPPTDAARSAPRAAGRVALTLAFLLGLAAPIAPITAYNRIVGKDWVLVSSQGGVNFWIGNNPRSDGASAIVPGTRADWWGGYRDSVRIAEEAEGRQLVPSEVSRYFSRKAWSWIRSDPGAAVSHALWKLRLFFTDWELSNDASERFFAYRYGPILRWLPLGFAALAPLALLGLALTAGSWRRLLPLWGFLPVYTASVVAFFVCSRFRAPVLPVMAILAAQACVALVAMARDRRFLALSGSALFLAATFAIVESIPSSIDRSDAKGLWSLGVAASLRGDNAAAVELYRASIAKNDHFSMSHQDLGTALRVLGRLPEAEQSFRRALALDPGNFLARAGLYEVLLQAGRTDEAQVVAEENVRRAPLYASAHYDLGQVLCRKAEELARSGGEAAATRALYGKALPEFLEGRRVATDESTAFNCSFAAAVALGQLDRKAEAAEAFRSALAARPDRPAVDSDAARWWWRCQTGLVETLIATGHRDEAASRIAELVRRYPEDANAKALTRYLGD